MDKITGDQETVGSHEEEADRLLSHEFPGTKGQTGVEIRRTSGWMEPRCPLTVTLSPSRCKQEASSKISDPHLLYLRRGPTLRVQEGIRAYLIFLNFADTGNVLCVVFFFFFFLAS